MVRALSVLRPGREIPGLGRHRTGPASEMHRRGAKPFPQLNLVRSKQWEIERVSPAGSRDRGQHSCCSASGSLSAGLSTSGCTVEQGSLRMRLSAISCATGGDVTQLQNCRCAHDPGRRHSALLTRAVSSSRPTSVDARRTSCVTAGWSAPTFQRPTSKMRSMPAERSTSRSHASTHPRWPRRASITSSRPLQQPPRDSEGGSTGSDKSGLLTCPQEWPHPRAGGVGAIRW